MPKMDFNQYSEHCKEKGSPTETHRKLYKLLKTITTQPLTLLSQLQSLDSKEFDKLADPQQLQSALSTRSRSVHKLKKRK